MLRNESKIKRIMQADLYQGNQWDRVLGSDEYTILYYIFRAFAFLIDKVRKVQYKKEEKQPRTQFLRRFVSIYSFI